MTRAIDRGGGCSVASGQRSSRRARVAASRASGNATATTPSLAQAMPQRPILLSKRANPGVFIALHLPAKKRRARAIARAFSLMLVVFLLHLAGELVDAEVATSATAPDLEAEEDIGEVHGWTDAVFCSFCEECGEIHRPGRNVLPRDEGNHGAVVVASRPVPTWPHPKVIGDVVVAEIPLVAADRLRGAARAT